MHARSRRRALAEHVPPPGYALNLIVVEAHVKHVVSDNHGSIALRRVRIRGSVVKPLGGSVTTPKSCIQRTVRVVCSFSIVVC